jgi:3-polyprenyl-4-hydroxybenzoate decarboxylase
MHYQDLIEFIDELEKQGELKRITLPGETQREWGKTIIMDGDVINKIDKMWDQLGID